MQIYKNKYQDDQNDHDIMKSSVLRIQNLQITLQRAIEDISLLQKNLAYVIELKEQLEAQLKVKQQREDTLIKQYQRQLAKKDEQISNLKKDREEIAELLSDTKDTLNNKQSLVLQRDQQKRRMQRIIQDQHSTVQLLEQQLLAVKYSCDLSQQSISIDNGKIQELERQNDNLRVEIVKLKNIQQRQLIKSKKLQKQIEIFKSWLGNVLGVRKVIEGCQSILMEQIGNRLKNTHKF